MSRSAPLRLFGLPLTLLLGVSPALAWQDDKPKVVQASLVIVTPMDIASVAVIGEGSPAREAFIEWVKPVFASVESQFAKETRRRTVVVQVTLHPDRVAEVAVAGSPALTDVEIKALLKGADAAKAPRSRIVDCELRVVVKINEGHPDANQPLSPTLPTPIERRLSEFRAATLPAKLALLKRWARSEAIPLIARMSLDADPKFVGVRNLGKALQSLKSSGPIDLVPLTDKNTDYWRAMLEMAPGIPLVPAVRAVLHVANGEIDSARRIVQTFAPFDRHQSGYSALISEFMAMSDLFYKEAEARIQKGIALNDLGKFDEALAVYEGLLKDYPRSAWAHYERYQTVQTKALQAKNPADKVLPEWAAVRKAILEADALYASMARASSADELYDLLLRKEIGELFRDKSKTVPDLLRFADVAVDLDQPGFAALIYWNLVSSVEPKSYKNRNLIEDVLYCLEQLGVKEIKQNFKGDHAAEFARIDAERAKRRRDSPASRVMAPKDQPKNEPK